MSLNSLLTPLTDKVDLLSIDVEGMELDVLRGFDFGRFQPELIILEQHGNEKDRATSDYLRERGYQAVAKKGCNFFFVTSTRKEFLDTLLYPQEKAPG